MNYRPHPDEWALWDTWLFPDPDGRRMHLFFLANKPFGDWEWIGHAVSDDLVDWRELPFIRVRRPDDACDARVIGTGMVFPSPEGGFVMSYTTNLESTRSRIAFLHSDDLMRWEKRWPEPRISADPRYYNTDPKKAPNGRPAFRDAFVHRVSNQYEALIAAESSDGEPLHNACIARYRADGNDLRAWKALPPLFAPELGVMMEVPEYFSMAGRHYLLWSNTSEMGVLCETPSRRRVAGTFYAMSDAYEGPYVCPAENLLLGAGDACPIQSYVARTVCWKGERLLYHHFSAPKAGEGPAGPAFAFPKRLVQAADGTLQAGYWPGVEKLHADQCPISVPLIDTARNQKAGRWTRQGTHGLRGSLEKGPSLVLLQDTPSADFHLRCEVMTNNAARFGLTVRDAPGEKATVRGVALQADFKHGLWQFAEPVHHCASRLDPVETLHEAPVHGRSYQIDLLMRDIYFEAYVDGVCKFTRVIAGHARRGHVGFFIESGSVRFDSIRIWNFPPMAHPFYSSAKSENRSGAALAVA